MLYHIDDINCACPACGRINTVPVPEAAVELPYAERCWHCGADFVVTTIAIEIHQDGTSQDPIINVTTTTEPGTAGMKT